MERTMRVAILVVLAAMLSGCWTPRLPQPRPPVVITQAGSGQGDTVQDGAVGVDGGSV